MKKLIMPIIAFAMVCLLPVLAVLQDNELKALVLDKLLTDGSASFSVRTATYNGPYAPRNAGVIWITDSGNQFVKTIKVWAASYRYTLRRWIANSGENMTGAITSASLNSHQLHNVAWDGKNWQNTPMPDGEYRFNIEFTEHNASNSNLGKYKQLSFVKGPNPVDLILPNETYFRDMHLSWTPQIVSGTISGRVTDASNNPIQGALVSAGDVEDVADTSGNYSLILNPGLYTVSCSAPGFSTQQIENVSVAAGETNPLNIIMNPVSNSDPESIPSALLLSCPYPNPTKSSSSISFRAAKPGPYELQVFNSRGQLVRTIRGIVIDDSWINLAWDGRDSSRQACPSGLYYLKLQSGGIQRVQKLTLNR